MVAVAGADNSGVAADFTCHGEWVDITAPGVDIVSTIVVDEEYAYGYMSGTSMATPHISGILALGMSVNPHLEPADYLDCLYSTATDIEGINYDQYSNGLGAGMVEAYEFVTCIPDGRSVGR
jgi:subtilisin family serine protease